MDLAVSGSWPCEARVPSKEGMVKAEFCGGKRGSGELDIGVFSQNESFYDFVHGDLEKTLDLLG